MPGAKKSENAPITPDGRYLVVRNRLWRCADPGLSDAKRETLVRELMKARRAKGLAIQSGDVAAREQARQAVDQAKHSLGERGPAWWTDGAPDWNRHLVQNTPYADWFVQLHSESRDETAPTQKSTPAKPKGS